MKKAIRATNFMQANVAEVIDRPFIYYCDVCFSKWKYIPSASRYRNIRAENFCKQLNKAIEEKEAANGAPQQTSIL